MKQFFLFFGLLTCISCSDPNNKLHQQTDQATFYKDYVLIGSDTIPYPGELELNILYSFSAIKSDTLYSIEVTRTSATILHYKFKCEKEASTIVANEGNAKLNEHFYLAPEGDDDPEEGEGYASYEYFNEKKNCNTSIRIGTKRDKTNRIRAKFTISCPEKSALILTTENTPVLKTEKQKQ